MLWGLFIFLCCTFFTFGDNTESKCFSKFDYDEKLLMKLVKSEHQIEILNSEKVQRKKEFETEMEYLRMKSAEEIAKQKNLTAMFVATLNSKSMKRIKSFNNERKEFRMISEEELQKQKDMTSVLLEKKNEQLKLFETEFEDFRQKVAAEVQKQQEKTKRLSSFEAEMEEFRRKNAEEINQQRNVSAILQMNDTLLNFLRAPVVIFTVTTPADGPTSDTLTFTREIINEGGGYNSTTGIFTCPIDGIYFFNLHLVKIKDSNVDQVSCYMKKNGVSAVRVHSDPRRNYGVYGVSNSAYLTLAMGDVVTIAGCYRSYQWLAHTVASWSSFSGYMVRPDQLLPNG